VIDKQNRTKIRIEIGAGMKPKKGRNSADNITTTERPAGSTTARLVNDYLVNDCPPWSSGSVKPIARIPEAWPDIAVAIQLSVDRTGKYRHIWMRPGKGGDPLGCRQ